MATIHPFIHDSLQLSSSFLLSVIALSALLTAAGLVLATVRRIRTGLRLET